MDCWTPEGLIIHACVDAVNKGWRQSTKQQGKPEREEANDCNQWMMSLIPKPLSILQHLVSSCGLINIKCHGDAFVALYPNESGKPFCSTSYLFPFEKFLRALLFASIQYHRAMPCEGVAKRKHPVSMKKTADRTNTPKKTLRAKTIAKATNVPSPIKSSQKQARSKDQLTARQQQRLARSPILITCKGPKLTAGILKGGCLGQASDHHLTLDTFWLAYNESLHRLRAGK